MTHQVRRGGTWYRTLLSNGRSTYRSVWPSRELPDDFTGFRVVCLPRVVTDLSVRGGSWSSNHDRYCRSASRGCDFSECTDSETGFRVVCLPPEVAPPRMVPPLRMIVRGGSWLSSPWRCHSASRFRGRAGSAGGHFGFRMVCLPPEVSTARCYLPLRGGPWRITCRSAYRGRFQPGYVSKGFGFRVVCLPREEAP
jgi:hypothetical protein